jgi:hypothetical protein
VAARHIPLPGVDFGAEMPFRKSGFYQIFSLGLTPWLTALAICEVLVLAAPPLRRSSLARGGHADPFSLWVILLTLLFASMQGTSMVNALLAAPGSGQNADLQTKIAMVSGLVGATAVLVAMGQIIERYGTGHGMWSLFATGVLLGRPYDARGMFQPLSERIATPSQFGAAVVASLVCMVLAVWLLLLRRGAGKPDFQPLVWPWLLTSAVAPLIAVFMARAFAWPGLYLAISALVFTAFSVLYGFRGVPRLYGLATVLVLVAAFAGETAIGLTGQVWAPVTALSIFVLAGLVLLAAWRHGAQPGALDFVQAVKALRRPPSGL